MQIDKCFAIFLSLMVYFIDVKVDFIAYCKSINFNSTFSEIIVQKKQ